MEENTNPGKGLSSIKAAREIVWLGIDFTRAKLIGPSGFTDVYHIRNSQFYAINQLWMQEPQKFNFGKYLNRTARYSVDIVHQRNLSIPTEGLVVITEIPNRLDAVAVQQVVDECTFPKEDHIGLLFIVESLDKNQAHAFAWVTFIDLSTSRIILTTKFAGRAMGFGFRNYWANAFHDILRRMPSMLK